MAKTTKPSDASVRRTAYREAGRAVAALVLLGRVGAVSIVAAKTPRARALPAPAKNPYASAVERDVVVQLAGREAERRSCGRAARGGRAPEVEGVRLRLLLAAGADERESDLWRRLLEYRARRLVALRWPQIQLLAAALLVRGTVSGVEARALVAALSPKDVAEIKVSAAAEARRRRDARERPAHEGDQ